MDTNQQQARIDAAAAAHTAAAHRLAAAEDALEDGGAVDATSYTDANLDEWAAARRAHRATGAELLAAHKAWGRGL